ncbi:MAG: S8 family serine peptidase, partial [Dehalococcoidia bacterium]|nr:S8 family serine peptidase [Dehalococcoidia bacterium]
LAASPGVDYAQPDFIRSVLREPNDWFYNNKINGNYWQWNLRAINAPAAWDITTGTPNAPIAIIDTGVDDRHADLRGKVVFRADFVNEDNLWDGLGFHGTHVAGIAAANTNNASDQAFVRPGGVAGTSWDATLISIKVADHWGKAKDSDAVAGIVLAADSGARIINLSFGGEDYSQVLQDAINYAYGKGILVVSAAGNCGDPATYGENDCHTVNPPIYPAADQNVLAVAATTSDNKRATFSEYGSYVAIAAPGDHIVSTVPNMDFGTTSGTSMASPHVAAVANLIWAVNPSLTNVQVANIITSTATEMGPPGKDAEFGYGLLNAQAALAKAELAVAPTQVGFMVPVTETRGQTSTITISSLATSFSWSAAVAPGAPWLSVNPSSGTTPGSATLSIDRGSMGVGRYDASVTFNVSGIDSASQAIAVPLIVADQVQSIFVPAVMKECSGAW